MVSTTRKVLIIEDSPSQAAVIGDLVKQAGFAPVIYNSLPGSVSQLLMQEAPSLVLLDLRLLDPSGAPVADGFHVCKEIKRFERKVPVIVITAEGDEEAYEWALLQGADGFLQKPFSPKDLTDAIQAVI